MGEAERYGEYKKPKKKFTLGHDGNALVGLVVLNIIFFILLLTLQVVFAFFQQSSEIYTAKVVEWFALPSDLSRFAERPWTILTYMFSDTGNNILRVLSNLLWLYAFGHILQQESGNEKVIPVFIYGGLFGGIAFIIASNLLPGNYSLGLLGANASTVAVAIAASVIAPQHRIFPHIRGGMSIWILTAIYLIINFAGISKLPAAYAIANAAGALAGFLFAYFLKQGRDGSVWMNNFYNGTMNLFNPNTKKSKNIKNKIFYNTAGRAPFEKRSNITQQRIDDLLDKINQHGYHSLSEEEKSFLKKASEEDL